MKQTSKQNITRDIKIKNRVTVTRGEEEITGERKGRVKSRNMCIKDPWTRTTGYEGFNVGEGWWVRQGKAMWGDGATVIKQQ